LLKNTIFVFMNFTGKDKTTTPLLRLRAKVRTTLLRLRDYLLRLMTSEKAKEKYQAIGLGVLFSILVFVSAYAFTFIYIWIKF